MLTVLCMHVTFNSTHQLNSQFCATLAGFLFLKHPPHLPQGLCTCFTLLPPGLIPSLPSAQMNSSQKGLL